MFIIYIYLKEVLSLMESILTSLIVITLIIKPKE